MAKVLGLGDCLLLSLARFGDFINDLDPQYRRGLLAKPRQKNYYSVILSQKYKAKEIKKISTKKGPVLEITRLGLKRLRGKFNLADFQNKPWDGQWVIVLFDIKKTRDYIRDRLRVKLQELNFAPLQQSVYISPYNISEDLHQFLEDYRLSGSVIVIETQKLWLEDEVDFVQKLFKIEELEVKYLKLMNRIKDFKTPEDQQTWFKSYLALKITDPHLPRKFLPKPWLGDEADETASELLKNPNR